MLTDKNGKVKWSASHTPFGSALIEVEKVENPFRFPGQYADPETGLHYNYFRDYDPGIGRYIESDPIGLIGGANTFIYGNVNPIRISDPQGLLFGDPSDFVLADAVATARGVATGTISALGAASTGVLLALFPRRLGDDVGELPTKVVAVSGFKLAEDSEPCEPSNAPDDFDPCEELLVALKIRMIQLLQRAQQGIDVTFEVRQYKIVRAEFCRKCPHLCNKASKIPPILDR